jgi:hypothetical protein
MWCLQVRSQELEIPTLIKNHRNKEDLDPLFYVNGFGQLIFNSLK